MEAKPIIWEIARFRKHFPCFIWGCKKEAEHLTKFMHHGAVVQVCLCDDCMHKSPEFILKGLKAQPEIAVN